MTASNNKPSVLNSLAVVSPKKVEVPDFSAEEEEIRKQEKELEERKTEVETKRKAAEHAQRQIDQTEYDRLRKVAANWRQQAAKDQDRETSAEKILWAEEAENRVAELALRLGIMSESTEQAAALPKPIINTNLAFGIIALIFLFCAGVTYMVGNYTMAHFPNDTTAMIMANTPLRIMLAFSVVFLAFMVAALIIRLFLTPLYRLWHSNVITTRSLQSVIDEAPAWAVLFSVLFSFYGVMELFVRIFISLFG